MKKIIFNLLLLVSLDCFGSEQISDPLDLAYQSFEQHNYSACVTLAHLASKQDLESTAAHFIMAKCYERLGEFESAYREFKIVSQTDPHNSDAFNNRAIQSLKSFKVNRVRQDLAEWKAHFPQDRRIRDLKVMLRKVLAEQKAQGYSDDEARASMKAVYLSSVRKMRFSN